MRPAGQRVSTIVVEVNPEKQGLKPGVDRTDGDVPPVVEVNPEKQGLKPVFENGITLKVHVVEVNPEKQGLKPFCRSSGVR